MQKKKHHNKRITQYLLLLAVVACSAGQSFGSGATWGYSGAAGPDHWGAIKPEYQACATGVNQSPVDLRDFVDASLPAMQLQNYPPTAAAIENNGHTIQVSVAPGSMLQLDGLTFELKQLHFHAPSENLIDGKSFPMEAHLVHKNSQGQLAVIAIMYTPGAENPFIAAAWQQMVRKSGEKKAWSSQLLPGLLPESLDYYRFNGSLTTPPCSEGVRWLVLTEPVSVSPTQVKTFEEVMGGPNNRPVQPLNARLILQ